MSKLETQNLIDPSNHSPATTHHHEQPQQETTRKPNNPITSLILQPFKWLKMLSSELNPSFILGIFLVYGLNLGFSGSFFIVVTDYYWKDVHKVQPSKVQLFTGLYFIPWVIKPVWGLLTDVFPIMGYKRRPYFIIAGLIGLVGATIVSEGGTKVGIATALCCLIVISTGMAIADVTIDACIARNSIEMKTLAPDMQSLCGVCSSTGALIGFATSGFFIHHLGAQFALGLLAIPAASQIYLGFVIYEEKTSKDSSTDKKQAMKNLEGALIGMFETIQIPQVWKPSLYMYLSLALSYSTHEGQFYWYTDSKAGPAFSQELVGIVHAIGALASIVGVLIYHKLLKDQPFRKLLFFVQLVYALSGFLDLIFILRWNVAIGLPDYLFVVSEECISRIVSRVRWMPMMVLSTSLCPIGIEGTFFALLMSIDGLGALTSKWGGGIVLGAFHVTRTNFTNLWLVILIRNIMRFVTLGFVFLLPNTGRLDVQTPPDVLQSESKSIDIETSKDNLQLLPYNKREEV